MSSNHQIPATRPAFWTVTHLPTSYFALVMATGIVSIAAHRLGMESLGKLLLGLNGLFYITLWILSLWRLLRYPRQILADLQDHSKSVGFFTWVAATGVLVNQCLTVASMPRLATTLFGLAVLLWIGFTYAVFTALTIKKEPSNLSQDLHGGWLVAVVATQSVSTAASLLAAHYPAHFELLIFSALITWLAGGMLYIWLISIIFYRYTFFTMEPADLTPPYWINMGAMAISTLAGTTLIAADQPPSFLTELIPFLKGFTLFFWATATWWIPMLLILGVWRHLYHRIPLRYDPHYWGAVFPLGMYTVCTFSLATVIDLPFLFIIPRLFIWIALSAWTLATIGMTRSFLNYVITPNR